MNNYTKLNSHFRYFRSDRVNLTTTAVCDTGS